MYDVIVKAIDGVGQIAEKNVKLTVGNVDVEQSIVEATTAQIAQATAVE